jgi:hypothetical protein
VSNHYSVNGQIRATCLCGATVKVTGETPAITENGLMISLCSDACDSMLHGMSPANRLRMELKSMHIFDPNVRIRA